MARTKVGCYTEKSIREGVSINIEIQKRDES